MFFFLLFESIAEERSWPVDRVVMLESVDR